MKNPLRSEADAFRFLLGTVVYFALIAIAGGDQRAGPGLVVFIVLTRRRRLVVVARRATPSGARAGLASAHRGAPEGERRILVVANETVGGEPLLEQIKQLALARATPRVLVVSPALNTPLQPPGPPTRTRRGRRPASGSTRSLAELAAQRRRRPAARSATATRCRRSRTRSARSAPTRS